MNETERLDELAEGLYDCGYIAVIDEEGELSFMFLKGELDGIEEEAKKIR